MNSSTIRGWLQRGELEKLENVVLEGRGARLLGEYSPDLKTRVFLKGLPNYLVRKSITQNLWQQPTSPLIQCARNARSQV